MGGILTHSKHLKFRALLPDKVKSATDADLRLSLVSLKNALSAISVHVSRIEQELENRHVSKYIIHQERDTSLNFVHTSTKDMISVGDNLT